MCGRFSIKSDREYIEHRFKAGFCEKFRPNSNASPGQILPVIKSDTPSEINFLKWGLSPAWYKKMKGESAGLINVRDDNLKLKRTFEKDLLDRRCLVLADGFYEWKKVDDKKVPYRFAMGGDELFAMAGIWGENVDKRGEKILTFAIVTTEANSDVKEIHNRMPVILEPEQEQIWLAKSEKNSYLSLLDPLPPGILEGKVVGKVINMRPRRTR